MAKKQQQQQTLSNNKKILQEQVGRLNNEIEELRLEREESKKNVLHFMQEADTTRQELKKAQDLIDELTASHVGYQSPPPEHVEKPKLSMLLTRISLLDEHKMNKLFQLLDQEEEQPKMQQLEDELKKSKSENVLLKDELEQLSQEYQATRGALQIENERAEIIEQRWKESESHLEQAESTIQALNKDLDYFRQQEWANSSTILDNTLSEKLCKLETTNAITVEKLDLAQSTLDEKVKTANAWQEKYNVLVKQYAQLENKQTELDAASKIRENHLRTINKTLRDEIRKVNKVQEEIINVEYLRNVIIKFLEKRNTRAQLVPILSILLQCSNEDQARLLKLTTRNRIVSS